PHDRGHGHRLPARGPAVGQLLLRPHPRPRRLSRLRGRHDARRREAAPGELARQKELPDPAQPRPPHLRPHGVRGLPAAMDDRARLPDPDGRAIDRPSADRSAVRGAGPRAHHAAPAGARRPPRRQAVHRAPAPRRPDRPELPDLTMPDDRVMPSGPRHVDPAYRHRPKRVTPQALLDLAGARLKWYDLAYTESPVPDAIRQLARDYL